MNIEHSVDVDDLIKRIAELEALVEELKEIIKIYEQNSEENLKQAKGEN